MSRYIDADKLLKSTISKFKCVPLVGVPSCRNGEEYFDGEDFDSLINEAPTADVVEVRHGYWVRDSHREEAYCSLCDGITPVDCEKALFYESDYCPSCGAKMDGERREE